MDIPPPPAGWYPNPDVPGTQRYWDGSQWTSHVSPPQPLPSPAPKSGSSLKWVWILGGILLLVLVLVGGCVAAVVAVSSGVREGFNQIQDSVVSEQAKVELTTVGAFIEAGIASETLTPAKGSVTGPSVIKNSLLGSFDLGENMTARWDTAAGTFCVDATNPFTEETFKYTETTSTAVPGSCSDLALI